MKIKALIFDLDGIITDTAQLHFYAWKEALSNYKIDFTNAENAKFKGLSRKDTLVAILNLKKISWTNEKIETVCFEKNQIYLKLLETIDKNFLLPGIFDLLTRAKAKNLKIGLASSSLNGTLILKKLEIYSFFDNIANPSEIRKPKPFPDIFLLAAEGLKISPQNCLAFEDSLSGFLAIKAAKMRSIVISEDKFIEFEQADFWLNSTSEINLDEILEKLELFNQ
ncbi:beta-phosphoglucomutase [Mesomycoplasma dispar]|uniref:Beta-phosphoglucomutase n=1 Tax=Mesomycoplasma dispar TaxID=86660 RepID=A0ABN5DSF1_9BACT|nr:beta-phosphoglucomutase [Mesomycoplasma dispar]ATP59815.1 beta-phosphoglucomutase [Mesomycoplasma dispar]